MRGAALNAAASDMVSASRGTSNQLAVSTKKFSLSYQDLLDSGLKLAGQAKVFWSTRRPACRMQKWINFPRRISEEAKETTSMQILRKQFNLSRKCGIWIVTTPNNMKLNWYWRQVYSEFIQNGIFGTHFGRIPYLEVLWFEIGCVRTWCIFFFRMKQPRIPWCVTWRTHQLRPVNSFWLPNHWFPIRMHLMLRTRSLMLQG